MGMNRFWVQQSLLISLMLLLVITPIGISLRYFLDDIIADRELLQQYREEDDFPGGILVVMGLGLIIGTTVGVIGSRNLSQPINTLVQGVRQIGSGKLGHQIKLGRASQELQELSTAINTMSIKLSDAEMQRRRLMADVSHELRTPLTVLEGHLRASLDSVYSLDESQIANLYGQTHHLIKLVDDLNLLAKVEANQLPLMIESIDVRAITSEVITNFDLTAQEEGKTLKLVVDDYLPTIRADIIRLRQVLSNLIDNALRYTSESDSIEVGITQVEKLLRITISDTGTGIDSKDIPHIFDRFYRTDKSRSRESGGSGLGLAIVKALVETQGGVITAQSAGINNGTIVTISFPIQ